MSKGLSTVTIIIPIYNIAPYIEECIRSVCNQTFKFLEIIIIDDGSTDGSSEICDKLAAADRRIKVIHQENFGVVKAREVGIDVASGEYISFVDGDDWIEPDMIEILLKQIGNADLATTSVCRELTPGRWINECDRFPEGVYSGELEVSEILQKMIYDFENEYPQPFIPGLCNKLFRTDLIKKTYKEMDADIVYEEDAVLTYKYLLQCQSVVISHKGFYHYRYRKGSAIHSVNRNMLTNINKVYLILEKDFRDHRLKDSLMLQLQRWIMFMSCRAVNDFMGFDTKICIPEYIANLSYLEDKKLILYGAGRAGQDTYAQMERHGYQVILWVDKNYKIYREKGLLVSSPNNMFDEEYDLIFIAVGDESLAGEIKKELLQKGVPESVLLWREPMRIF